jgi:hypothetical protein
LRDSKTHKMKKYTYKGFLIPFGIIWPNFNLECLTATHTPTLFFFLFGYLILLLVSFNMKYKHSKVFIGTANSLKNYNIHIAE